jgi:predicted nucleic acid-binding protein
MNETVYLDSGIFIAALVRRDSFHAQAVELFGRPTMRWITSVLVVSESYSWFLHRHGEEAARKLCTFLSALTGLQFVGFTPDDHQRALHILDRFRGAKLTYVDATSLALLEQRKIRTVWSTDHHLSLTGAEILPRS